jgi:DNA polymerase III delta prime subunit
MKEILLKTITELPAQISLYYNSPELAQFISVLKIVSVALSIFLLFAVVVLIIKLRKGIEKSVEMAAESMFFPDSFKEKMSKDWQSVLDKLKVEDENSYKLAIIEADKILDDILKRIGYQGEDMGERLKQINRDQMGNIDEVWQAHKLRNQIVHQPNFRLNRGQTKRAIEAYQRALENLEAL